MSVEWGGINNPLHLVDPIEKSPLDGDFNNYSKQSDKVSLAHSTKCLSSSFIAGVKIEITTNGSLPVTFVE